MGEWGRAARNALRDLAALGNLVKVFHDADPVDKMKIYERLGLRLIYNPGANASP